MPSEQCAEEQMSVDAVVGHPAHSIFILHVG